MSPRRKIESCSYEGKKRVNNPPVGLVDPGTDPDRGEKTKRMPFHYRLMGRDKMAMFCTVSPALS